jgi:hypothetical protein
MFDLEGVIFELRSSHYGLIVWLVLAGICVTMVPGPANAQMSKQEKERITSNMAAEINRSIKSYPKEDVLFREKIVSRLIQCGDLFVLMSRHTDPETGKRIADVAEISLDVSKNVSEGIGIDRLKEITSAAQRSIRAKLAAEPTQESEQEVRSLLNNCKSFHKPNEVSDAVAALLPSQQ